MSRRIGRLFIQTNCVVALCLIACVAAQTLQATTLDATFLAGLRERGLYRLAEKQGQGQWNDEKTTSDERVVLAIELAKTYAEWAVSSPPRERNSLWENAHAIVGQFDQIAPDHPRRILIVTQDALAWLAAGEIARLESGDVAGPTAFDVARDRLRRAIRVLERLNESAATRLRERRLGSGVVAKNGENHLSVDELDGLSRHIAIELARALRNQALCFPAGSPDRVNALSRALEQLGQPGMADEGRPHCWRVRLDSLACHRLLGHGNEARRQMRAMLDAEPPDAVALRIEAERVRLLLAEGNLSAALAAVAGGRTIDRLASPQLDFAHLEVLLAVRDDSANAPRQNVAARITAQVERIRETHSVAWTRRAEMRVGRAFAAAVAKGDHGGNVDALRLAAESLYRAGKLEEAIAAFDKASLEAAVAKDEELAFSLAFTAAAIKQQAGSLDETRDRYERLAFRSPNHPRAAESHRLAILCAADLTRKATDDESRRFALARFSQLLAAHVEKWPESPTAGESWLWQGNLDKTSRKWDRAQQAYRHVRRESEHFEAATLSAAVCYEHFLAKRKRRGEKRVTFIDSPPEVIRRANIAVPELAQEATSYLQPIITGPDNRWPDPWSPFQRQVALPLARIQLDFAADARAGHEYAQRLLVAALASADSADQADHADGKWHARANAQLAEVLFVQGKTDEVPQVLQRIPAGHTAMLLPLARRAAQLLRPLPPSPSPVFGGGGWGGGRQPDPPNSRPNPLPDPTPPPRTRAQQTGELVLQIADRLDTIRDSLGDLERKDVDSARAAALAAVGRRAEALLAFDRLLEQHPADGHLHESRAALLSQSNRPVDRKLAMRAWRQVERRSTQGGPRWFRARIARCELLIRLQQQEEAAKLIRLTQALHPDLGGAPIKKEFKRLAQSAADPK